MDCWQIWGGVFTLKLPHEVLKKLHLFMLRGPRIKTLPSCSLGFPEYGMTNSSNVNRGFTPHSNPKRGRPPNKKIDIYLCKSAKAKTQCHSLPYSVLRVRNDQWKHFKCDFTYDSNPKRVKIGNKIGIYLYKRTKVKITDIAYVGLPRVRTDQCQHLK